MFEKNYLYASIVNAVNQFIKYILIISLSTFLLGCKQQYKLTDSKSENKEINNELSTSDYSETIITPYRDKLKSQMDEVINTSIIAMEVGAPEGLLGNFICDLTFLRAKKESDKTIDFCLLNNGGLRTPLPKGEITRGKIFELMPFENEIVIVEISGEKMLELIEYVKTKSLMTNSRKAGVPVSGFRMTINNDKVTEVRIGMNTFDKAKNYRIATSDYLSNGGDHMDFFIDAVSIENTGIKLRDAILDYIVELKEKGIELNAALDGRIYHAE